MEKSQKIGVLSAIVVQTNAMIGAGIVAIPAILAQTTGAAGLISFVAAVFIILCMTFSMGELSLLHGGQGWCYRFPHILSGHRFAMFTSFCYVFGVLVAMGFVAKQGGIWLHEVFPYFSATALSLSSLLILSLLVIAGKNVAAFWQYLISITIFLGILVTTAICFGHFDEKIFFSHYETTITSLFSVTPMLLFSFLGFESICSLYAIIKNPRKNVLRGGMIGVIIVGALYLLFSAAVIGSVAPSYFSSGAEEHSLAKVLVEVFPKFQYLSTLIYLGGLFAILGTLHSMIWSIGVLSLDVLNKSKSPRVHDWIKRGVIGFKSSVVVTFIVIALANIFLTAEAILNLAVLIISTAFICSIAALFKEKDHRFRNRLICIFGLIGAALMVIFSGYSLIKNFF